MAQQCPRSCSGKAAGVAIVTAICVSVVLLEAPVRNSGVVPGAQEIRGPLAQPGHSGRALDVSSDALPVRTSPTVFKKKCCLCAVDVKSAACVRGGSGRLCAQRARQH